MRLQLKIINLLLSKKNLTINQIAKELNESYSFVNRTISTMIQENILLKEKIGHSIICNLNKKNDKTKALINLNEVNKKQKFLEKNKELKLITDEIEIEADSIGIFGSYAKSIQTKESDIDIFIITNKKPDLTSLVRNIHAKYGKEITPLILTKSQFKTDKPIIKEIFQHHILLTGFEYFINLMLENET